MTAGVVVSYETPLGRRFAVVVRVDGGRALIRYGSGHHEVERWVHSDTLTMVVS